MLLPAAFLCWGPGLLHRGEWGRQRDSALFCLSEEKAMQAGKNYHQQPQKTSRCVPEPVRTLVLSGKALLAGLARFTFNCPRLTEVRSEGDHRSVTEVCAVSVTLHCFV